MEYILNSTDDFVFEPDPIQSNSKFTFQREEYAREMKRRNEPASTRALEVAAVVGFIIILLIILLIYIKYCHTAPTESVKHARSQYRVKGGRWIPVPFSTDENDSPASTSLFIPTQMDLVPFKGPALKCPKPACVCAPGGGNRKTKTKGWRRAKDEDVPYGPSNV